MTEQCVLLDIVCEYCGKRAGSSRVRRRAWHAAGVIYEKKHLEKIEKPSQCHVKHATYSKRRCDQGHSQEPYACVSRKKNYFSIVYPKLPRAVVSVFLYDFNW